MASNNALGQGYGNVDWGPYISASRNAIKMQDRVDQALAEYESFISCYFVLGALEDRQRSLDQLACSLWLSCYFALPKHPGALLGNFHYGLQYCNVLCNVRIGLSSNKYNRELDQRQSSWFGL